MRKDHFKLYAAIFPMIFNSEGQILLHKRQNTGYMDGYWDLAGTGHLDAGETAREAVIRECLEELGIDITPEALQLVHTVHRVGQEDAFPYLYLYFMVKQFTGQPRIMEARKNAELAWFFPDKLPTNMISDRKIAVQKALSGQIYDEWRT
ncbi:NUDIX domain-containing protein [Streptococcus ovuberis]|uniref:8-oxo-dGTP diphosphatase n=1 Tax=Streptococcus ovuberis TaxID=1936207 RepID=A0A7X6S0W0_9STRE|nr:NUDIX domain-containing protein [Streptococcus ovuberis]NKZ20524.1 NUDIX domain-containing protein [Streptococcus ovuberis]